MEIHNNTLSDGDLVAEFKALFPHGFAGDDVMKETAPEGWQASPLAAVFHPSAEQVYEESLRIHRNLASLRRPDASGPAPPEPTWDEIAIDFQPTPIDSDREVRELVGQCLWDVFSDGHEVTAIDGRRLDLGSFRGSGGFLADLLNEHVGASEYDYLSFYMGTNWASGRADLTPIYRMIFRRLRDRQLDWHYHFPRLYAVDMRPLKKLLDDKHGEPNWTGYDPATAFAEQEQERKHEEELVELRESLEEGYQESVAAALKEPPPVIVRAYQVVYRHLPRGWPPSVSN